jgi:hypothetical protein
LVSSNSSCPYRASELNPSLTNNTIDKKKPIAMIYKTLHGKLTINHHEPHKKRVELRCSVKVRRV